MSNVVDDRVVKMKFDNAEFESNVQDTMKSLDDLDKSLKGMDKSSYGDNLGSALGGIGSAVDDLSERFSAWGIVGMEVIRQVTQYAVNEGAKMVKALSIDNMTAGWQSYETISSSVYALMSQTGMASEEAYEYMRRLGKYADYTSFDLATMASKFQEFMAQGLSASEAEAVIYGIGNSITYAGKGAKEGSEAFEYFSKAFGRHFMDRRTWDSLSRSNIMTAELKQQYLDAAVAVGELRKEADGSYTVLRTMLNFDDTTFLDSIGAQEGKWITDAVLMKVYGEEYGNYAYEVLNFADSVEQETGEMLTYNQAIERFTDAMEGAGEVVDEFGKKVLDSATVAKILSEAIDAVKDQSKTAWMNIFQAFFGDVEYAKEIWGELSDYLTGIFVTPLANMGTILNIWAKLGQDDGGRDSFIQSFRNLAQAVESIKKPIRDAYDVIFNPEKDPNALAAKFGNIIKNIENFTESLILNEDTAAKFQRVWEVIFEVLKTVATAIEKIWNLLKGFGSIVKPILGLLGNLVVGISEVIDVIFKVFNLDGNLWTWLDKPTNALKKIGAALSDTLSVFDLAKGPVIEGVVGAFDTIGESADVVTDTIEGAGKSLYQLWEEFKKTESFTNFEANGKAAFENIKNANSEFINSFKQTYSESGGGIVGVAKGAYAGIKGIIQGVYDSLNIMLDGHFGGAMEKIKEFATWIETTVSTAAGTIKKLAGDAMTAITGGIFGESIFGDMTKSQEDAGEQLTILERMRQNIDKEMKSTQVAGKAMSVVVNGISAIGIGGAMLRLNQILKNISELFKSMKGTWNSIGRTFDTITTSLKTMQLEIKADIIKDIALALLVLAASMVVFSMIPTDKILPAIGVMTALITEMGLLMYAVSRMDFESSNIEGNALTKKFTATSSGITKAASAILVMSGAVLVLASAMKTIADIPTEDFGKALGGVSALLLELAVFAKFTDSQAGGLGGNVGMNVFKMASGLVVMAQAMKMLAELDEDDRLGKGLGAVGGILTMLFTFSAAMEKWGGGKDIGDMGSLIALAAGLAALALVIKTFANIPTDELIKGGIAVAGALTAVALFMAIMKDVNLSSSELIAISGAIVIFSAGLLVMAGALAVFNLVQWDSIGQAATMLGAFILAVALIDTLHLDTTMIGFGVAVAAFGVGIGALGAGLLAAATALALIGVELPLIAGELIETIRTFLAGIVSLKPELVAAIISLIETMCEAIVGTWDTVLTTLDTVALLTFEHFLSTLAQLVEILEKYWPTIRDALAKVGNAILGKLKEWAPKVWEWVKNTMANIAATVREHWPEWLAKLGNFFINVLAALGGFAIRALGAVGQFFLDILASAGSKVVDFLQAGKDLIEGLWDGFTSKFEEAIQSVKDFINDIIDGILGFFGTIWNTGVGLIDSLLGGIFSKNQDAYDAGAGTASEYNAGVEGKTYESKRAGEKLGGAVSEGAESVSLFNIGVNAVQGLLDGLNESKVNKKLIDKAKNLGDTVYKYTGATLQIKSPSKKMEYIGRMATKGYLNGLLSEQEYNDIIRFAYGIGGATVDYTIEGLQSKWPELFADIDEAGDEAAEHASEAGEKTSQAFTDSIDPNPTITVVVDTKDFEEKLEYINEQLDKLQERREEEMLLGAAANSDTIEMIDREIELLTEEQKQTDRDVRASHGLGGDEIDYELRDMPLNSKKMMEYLGLGGDIDYELRDKYLGKDKEKEAIDRVFNNITVNQTIKSSNPVTPTEMYRAGQYIEHGIQPYYDPDLGKYVN